MAPNILSSLRNQLSGEAPPHLHEGHGTSRAVDTTTWFSLDRIELDTASPTLRASSNDQLDAIAAIPNASPSVSLKIGGDIDNGGDETLNKALSASRADNTKQALVTRGIATSRLDADGSGKEHPVASNDTEDGRQHNRRLDVRVTAT
ncbi:MAG: OmpA family protein [Acidobacteria bacterium]|nr:OmpA family protein [Acidobacteriota bacterium]